MSRADLAAFLIGRLTDTTYLRAAPAVSNQKTEQSIRPAGQTHRAQAAAETTAG